MEKEYEIIWKSLLDSDLNRRYWYATARKYSLSTRTIKILSILFACGTAVGLFIGNIPQNLLILLSTSTATLVTIEAFYNFDERQTRARMLAKEWASLNYSYQELWNSVAVWEKSQERRNAVDALDRFDRICDLPQAATLTEEIPFLNFKALRDTAGLYGHYFLAGLSAGQPQEAAEAFCRLNRVIRNGLDNATLLVNKMIFAGLLEMAIDTTWTALQNENMDRQTLIALHETFSPVGFEEMSLARPLISEYLIMKNSMRGLVPGHLMDLALPVPGNAGDVEATNGLRSRGVYFLGFKPNRTLADMKIYHDQLIEAGRRHPVDLTRAEAYM
jgi:hypothetical protein